MYTTLSIKLQKSLALAKPIIHENCQNKNIVNRSDVPNYGSMSTHSCFYNGLQGPRDKAMDHERPS